MWEMLNYVQRIIFIIEIFFGQSTYGGGQGQDLGVGTSEKSCHPVMVNCGKQYGLKVATMMYRVKLQKLSFNNIFFQFLTVCINYS